MARLAALALGLVILCGPALARHDATCHGQDLEQSKSIIEDAWRIGLDIGLTQDMNLALQKMVQLSQELNVRAQALPYPCQMLVQQWANAIGGAFQGGGYGGGTQCMGGVCCDGTGCY